MRGHFVLSAKFVETVQFSELPSLVALDMPVELAEVLVQLIEGCRLTGMDQDCDHSPIASLVDRFAPGNPELVLDLGLDRFRVGHRHVEREAQVVRCLVVPDDGG